MLNKINFSRIALNMISHHLADLDCKSFEHIARLTSDILWEWDLVGKKLKRESGLSEKFDYYIDQEHEDEQWWLDHIHEEDRNRVKAELNTVLADAKEQRWESVYRFYREDGSCIWAFDRAIIFRDKRGKAVRLLGSMVDITERKNTQDKLKIRLKMQKAISELSQEALSFVNIYAFLQQAAHHLQSYLDVEFIKILELSPDGNELLLRAGVGWNRGVENHSTIVETGTHSQSGYTLLSKKPVIVRDLRKEKRFSGPNLLTQHNVRSGMSVILYGNYGIFGILGAHTKKIRDFTHEDIEYLQSIANIISLAIQRHQTEEELRKSQAQFKALYDANIIGVMYENTNGDITEANDAFLKMLGYTRTEFERKQLNWRDITPEDYEEADRKAVSEAFSTGIAQPYEKEYLKKDGTGVPAIVGAVMLNREKGEVLAFALDITERKELERKKDEFMSIASHELRTPLTSIKGYTQILERIIQQMGDDKLKAYLKRTSNYVDRLNSLIAELLDVSKIQAGKLVMDFDTFDFDNFVRESVESVQHYSTKHKIVLNGKARISLLGDKNRLEQVFTNLITNAMKYSPNGDKVEIDIRIKDHKLVVSVRDYGIGISQKDQKKLFSRFYRVESASQKFSGLGIGLYISCEIVRRHGGEMWVSSKKGKGSTFYFSLPIYTMNSVPLRDDTSKMITE